MEQITNSQKKVLYAMAQIPDANITFSVVKKCTGIGKGTFAKNLVRLEEKGFIYKVDHGIYRFSLPMLRDYLLRRATLDSS